MVVLSCPITDCGFKTDDVDLVGAATILSVYAHAHTIPHPNATPVTLLSGPKLVRPRILYNVEVWNAFLRRWALALLMLLPQVNCWNASVNALAM